MGPLNIARRLVPPSLKVAIKKRLGIPLTRLHDDWRILAPIGPVYRPHVIIDAGSHHGWFFHCWKDWCPEATVHAFDADAEACARSEELYGGRDVTINHIGLGRSRSRLEFNVMESSRVSSSFLLPEEETWREIDYHTGPITTRSVEVIPLDDYVRKEAIASIYLMKIDVQGYEIEVLEGAVESLARTDYIFVEAGIRALYQGAPRFTHVHEFLDAHGFHLIAMRAWHRGNLTLVETDMLFRRNELMPAVDPASSRVMGHV
ncbi:MAG TPA: FkbM family methyltransferase [Thermoanaerobaculia bacterium]